MAAYDSEASAAGECEDMSIADKVAHVKSAKQSRNHECHWPGCNRQVPPAMWGCSKHWFMLPVQLRNKIWATYKIGQEITMTPSPAYLEVADEVQRWIKDNGKSHGR